MPMPTDVGVIDLMLGIPSGDPKRWYDFLRTQLLDHESPRTSSSRPSTCSSTCPTSRSTSTTRSATCSSEMDKHGIEPGR